MRVYTEREVHCQERRRLGVSKDAPLAALCLSGGGIRSAAFCLGALQALAAKKLLTEFHYLSTVSGGGYVGGWLTRCICETAEREAARHDQPPASATPHSRVDPVQTGILGAHAAEEPEQLRNLRHYTNFLTPHAGFGSDDTWAGILLWLRNTLINWMVFLPLLLATAAVPVGYYALVCALGQGGTLAMAVAGFGGCAGLACLAVAVWRSIANLPSHVFPDTDARAERFDKLGLDAAAIRRKILRWALAWAFLAPLAFAPLLHIPEDRACARAAFVTSATACRPAAAPDGPAVAEESRSGIGWVAQAAWMFGRDHPLALVPVLAWMVCMGAYGIAFWTVARSCADAIPEYRRLQLLPFKNNIGAWAASSLASVAVLGLGAWLADGRTALLPAVVGPLWVIGAEILRSSLYVAFRRDGLRSDLDREWLARLNAGKLRATLGYAAAAAAALLLPRLVLDTSTVWNWILALAGFSTGPIAAFVGKSGLTSALPRDAKTASWVPLDKIMGVAVAIFAAAMLMLAGRLAALIAWHATDAGFAPATDFWLLAVAAFGLAVAAGAAGFGVGVPVNLNRFSMHAVYRNRLVRAFLGSARKRSARKPDAYTGFDPRDDVRVADTFRRRRPARLFPVINVALNRTSGSDTARAERKAESFTITPLHCGSSGLTKQAPPTAGAKPRQPPREGAYVATPRYAGAGLETGPGDRENGIRLGTAIAISGAAASPDMGYRSQPYTAFLMTLFNVRLGAWLPNPGAANPTDDLMRSAGPRNAVRTMLSELAGRSGVSGDFVYLSDGGHFDNLGLYEMLRRRCTFIVVVDAGQDPDYGYSDLGRTLQHALVDQGVEVEFLQPLVTAAATLQQHGAYGRITYPGEPPTTGELLYLKPWLPPEAPTPLQAFKAANKSYPHGSTLNQFFTESDFESYRRLGEYLMETALGHGTATLQGGQQNKLECVFTELRHCASAPRTRDNT